jgi:hypothetical protein
LANPLIYHLVDPLVDFLVDPSAGFTPSFLMLVDSVLEFLNNLLGLETQ